MKLKDINQIIKEEVGNFDFASLNSIKEEDKSHNILNSRQFQTNLVHDTLNKRVQWKLEEDMTTEPEDDDWGNLVVKKLYKDLNTVYNYNGVPYQLTMFIEGENIPVNSTGANLPSTQVSPEEKPEPDDAQYAYNADINLFDREGNPINMNWIDNEININLKERFITSILGPLPY